MVQKLENEKVILADEPYNFANALDVYIGAHYSEPLWLCVMPYCGVVIFSCLFVAASVFMAENAADALFSFKNIRGVLLFLIGAIAVAFILARQLFSMQTRYDDKFRRMHMEDALKFSVRHLTDNERMILIKMADCGQEDFMLAWNSPGAKLYKALEWFGILDRTAYNMGNSYHLADRKLLERIICA